MCLHGPGLSGVGHELHRGCWTLGKLISLHVRLSAALIYKPSKLLLGLPVGQRCVFLLGSVHRAQVFLGRSTMVPTTVAPRCLPGEVQKRDEQPRAARH